MQILQSFTKEATSTASIKELLELSWELGAGSCWSWGWAAILHCTGKLTSVVKWRRCMAGSTEQGCRWRGRMLQWKEPQQKLQLGDSHSHSHSLSYSHTRTLLQLILNAGCCCVLESLHPGQLQLQLVCDFHMRLLHCARRWCDMQHISQMKFFLFFLVFFFLLFCFFYCCSTPLATCQSLGLGLELSTLANSCSNFYQFNRLFMILAIISPVLIIFVLSATENVLTAAWRPEQTFNFNCSHKYFRYPNWALEHMKFAK